MRFIRIVAVAVGLVGASCASYAQVPPNTSARPTLRFEKTRFVSTESVFFWVGVTRTETPIPVEVRKSHRVLITRPDGTVKVDQVGWPVDGNPDSGGWSGGWGLGTEALQVGRYTAVVEFAGYKTDPITFTVEDISILKSITGEFMFPSPLTFGANDRVVLRVRNGSTETIRFPHRGQMDESISVTLRKTTGANLWSASYFVPDAVLIAATGFPRSRLAPDKFSWGLISQIPTVTLKPGENYLLELPVPPIVASYRSSAGPFSMTAAEYDMELSTTMQVLVGEIGGPWEALSPLRLNVSTKGHGILP